MKRLFFICLIGLISTTSFAQSLPDFDAIQLNVKEDYDSVADNAALQAANYLFDTPMEKNNINRLKSLRFIIRWMTGTPNYSFALDEQATKFAKKNDDLLGLYMAGMTKFALENKADAKDPNKVKLNTVRLILRYVKEEKNNVKLNSELKKAIEAEEKGELPAYLKI